MEHFDKVLTVGDLARYLRVHRSTIYRLLKKGDLPGFKIGSDWRFNVEAIDEWRLHQEPATVTASHSHHVGRSHNAAHSRSAEHSQATAH